MLTIQDINTEINGVPRVLDTRLAEALGFKRPRKIREIIAPHIRALEKFGELKVESYTYRGQSATRYYLTEKQALYLCTKSQAEKAIDITIQMVELFYQVRHGQMTTALPAPTPSIRESAMEDYRSAYISLKNLLSYIESASVSPHSDWQLRQMSEFAARRASACFEDIIPADRRQLKSVPQYFLAN